MRQEVVDLAGRLRRQALQHVLEVGVGLVPIDPRRVQQAHDGRRSLPGAQAAGEEPVRSPERDRPEEGQQPTVAQLMRLVGIGARGACVLAHEIFGWRKFANRRELAGCLGVAPTPYASGDSQIEQGISKAGNRRARTLLTELAWCWLRLQPDSALTKWFNERFARGGARMRRIGIVALARRLAIAIWRFLRDGELPTGARLKALPTSAPSAQA